MEKFFHRGDAPFNEKLWGILDETVNGAAKSQLTARRVLDVDGPYGMGLKYLAGADRPMDKKPGGETPEVLTSCAIPVVAVQKSFVLPARDIAHFEETGLPLDMKTAALASIACARQEDSTLLYGADSPGFSGLLNTRGTRSMKLKKWDETGKAAEDIMQALTMLDNAGFHGPYALALAPTLYNMLFRRYPQGDQVELAHVREMAETVVKAPAIASGGVLLARGKQFASIVIGQDLITRFVGPSGGGYEFMVFESFALRLLEPAAVCVLQAE